MKIWWRNVIRDAPPREFASTLLRHFHLKVLDDVLRAHRLHLDANSDQAYRSMHVKYGHCSAEIVANKFHVNPYYYYVVEQAPSSANYGMGDSS